VEFFSNDQLHRDGDEPASISEDGTVAYYVNDQLHRDGDQPAVVYADGTAALFYVHGEVHRG